MSTAVLLPCEAPASQVVFDHPPHNFGGPASDTEFLYFGTPYSQQLADDFELGSVSTIVRINWWGFYDLDNPPATESFQLNIYDTRMGAELPGSILYSAILDSPSRAATGRLVAVTVLPKEYLYSAALSVPFVADANVPYWLEIAQVGDLQTSFRWEDSITDRTGHAYLNDDLTDWTHTNGIGDLAFQLLTPEPATAALAILSLAALRRCRCRSQGRRRG